MGGTFDPPTSINGQASSLSTPQDRILNSNFATETNLAHEWPFFQNVKFLKLEFHFIGNNKWYRDTS